MEKYKNCQSKGQSKTHTQDNPSSSPKPSMSKKACILCSQEKRGERALLSEGHSLKLETGRGRTDLAELANNLFNFSYVVRSRTEQYDIIIKRFMILVSFQGEQR